jgi:two-component system, cell cycle sensor histidine kinase and response regulator CckA
VPAAELNLAHPIKVLLVEDDPAAIDVLLANLAEVTTARFDLTPAQALSSAIEELERTRFDVVLLDLGLPDSKGLGTLAAVHKTAPRVPIVVLTGHSDEALAVRAAQTGAQDYLVKGLVDNQSLVRSIRYAIERKRGEEALRQSEERLRFALAAARMGIWEWQPREDHLTLSDELVELLGVDARTFPGTFDGLLSIMHPDDRESVRVAAQMAREQRSGSNGHGNDDRFEVAFRLAPKARSDSRWVLTKGRVVRTAAGMASRLTGTMMDVTEHKQLEARLLQSQKLESIGRLAGGVAHDFNNLLTVILGAGYLAERDPLLPPTSREHLESIREAAERASQLTSQLLAFARKQVFQLRVLDAGDVVREMQGMLRRLIGEDVELRTSLAPGLWPLRADRAQLEQVLVNLSVNGRDAMPGGGALTIETRNVTLGPDDAARVGVAAGEWVRLAVSDTGVGMDESIKEHIFEPFFTTKGRAGTGLGLATCYGIVTQLGGTITVETAPGKGSTFTVLLPRVRERVEVATKQADAVQGGRETVLIVEDEPLVRNLATNGLALHGYRVLAAASGQEALELLRGATHVDLLVTDVIMPGMGGRALAEQARVVRPSMKLVFMSGYTETELPPGAAFLQKPFTPAVLARTVREALDARAPRR